MTSLTANQKTSDCMAFICIVLVTAVIWLIEICGSICDRSIVKSCVISVDYSRRSADITITTSHRADLCGLQGLSRMNPNSEIYFLLSPDL